MLVQLVPNAYDSLELIVGHVAESTLKSVSHRDSLGFFITNDTDFSDVVRKPEHLPNIELSLVPQRFCGNGFASFDLSL